PLSPACRRTERTRTGVWRSRSMATASSSAPTRMLFLLHGEDPFRIRLRANELVLGLLAGGLGEKADLAARKLEPYGGAGGSARLGARSDPADAILVAGQSQGLVGARDGRR